jgi:hypothetical protein
MPYHRTADLLKASPEGEGFHPPRDWKMIWIVSLAFVALVFFFIGVYNALVGRATATKAPLRKSACS